MVEQKPDIKKVPEGKLYEKYVGQLFELAGFDVDVNTGFFDKGDIKHQIDIVVGSKNLDKPIFIECKNVSADNFKKELIDAFMGKLSDLEGEYSKACFFVHLERDKCDKTESEETLKQYRQYCKRKGIVFFDESDFKNLRKKVKEIETNKEKQRYILRSLETNYSGTKGNVGAIILIVLGILTLPIIIGIIPLIIGVISLVKNKRKLY
ncbi:restriction endonuclease [Candidatus Woesearchaeota archaeon]|nr:restriction endonuclease [Candidatus Woesearchaeota archaeon]